MPLIVWESTSDQVRNLLRADPEMVVWWGTEVEVSSALARLERSDQLDREETELALEQLARLAALWKEVAPVDALRPAAKQLLRRHKLRAPDALQLTSALSFQAEDDGDLAFVSLDDDLVAAARGEGLTVIDAETLDRSSLAISEASEQAPADSEDVDAERS